MNLRRGNRTLNIYINYQHRTPLPYFGWCSCLLLGYVGKKIQKHVHSATGSIFADFLALQKIIVMRSILVSSIGTLLEGAHLS